MSVRALLMSVAVASGSAFCVSPQPQLAARRSLPRRPRTMPARWARIGGRRVDTRIVDTKVGPHSHSRATRLRLLALAPRSLPHSFHVPTRPDRWIAGGVAAKTAGDHFGAVEQANATLKEEELRRRKLQETTVALEQANAKLEELRGGRHPSSVLLICFAAFCFAATICFADISAGTFLLRDVLFS